jgi:cold shock CspA family protein
MSSKKRQQTFAKLKREQAVRERRERKQEAKKAARQLKAEARNAAELESEAETPRPSEPVAQAASVRRGIVAEAVAEGGLGFIEPSDRGGLLPMRASNVDVEDELQPGDAVEYSLAAGSMGVEAVEVKALAREDEAFDRNRPGPAERRH